MIFLHMDFYRPTLLIVSNDHQTYLITPLLDVLLVPENCPVDKVETWNDGIGNEWRELLPQIINQHKNVFIEKFKINQMVKTYLDELFNHQPGDLTSIIDSIRMIKSDYELNIARHAGQVGMAMMEAAKKQLEIMYQSMRLHLLNHRQEREKQQNFYKNTIQKI